MRALALGLALCCGASMALAQVKIAPDYQIWDVELGKPVTQIPEEAMATIYCGTNGGPASIPLTSFEDFALCPAEPDGLREVGFSYDDEQAYIARALEVEFAILKVATRVFGHPAIVSVLIDDAGLVQGIRIVTDDRTSDTLRRRAIALADQFRAQYGDHALVCEDLPLSDGEQPLGRIHVKQTCTGVSPDGTRSVMIEARYLRKKGQTGVDSRTQRVNTGYFESRTRLEVRQVAGE